MDRKTLNAIIDSLIVDVALEQGLEKEEAQTMLGIALKKNREAIVKAVVVPTLGLVPKTA